MTNQSPIRSAVILLVSVLITEALLMILLSLLPPLPDWMGVLLDSTALAVLLLPASFFLVFRPLHAEIAERRRAEEALRRRDAILEAVTFAADRFLQAAWEQSVREVLARLGQAARASRIYIFQNHVAGDGALLTSQRYEWAAPGIAPQIDNPQLQDFPLRDGGFVRWEETLGGGRPIYGHVRQFPESERDILTAQDILSIAVVPIFVERAWWGFIGLDECLAEREWSAPEIEALRAAADILGAAQQRAQRQRELDALYEQTREQARDLALLNEMGQLLASALDVETILAQLARRCVEAFGVDSCLVRLIEDDHLVVKGSYFRHPQEQTSEVSETSEVYRLGEGIAGRVAATGQAEMSQTSEVCWLVVPMKVTGQAVGVLTLMTGEAGRPFTERDRSLAQEIGDLAALTIQNARLLAGSRDAHAAVLNMLDDLSRARDHERARAQELEIIAEQLSAAMEDSDRLAMQLATVNRLDRIISSSLDLNEVYRAFAEESKKIIPYDRMAVALMEGDQVQLRAVGAGIEAVEGVEAVFPLAGSIIEAVIESGRALIRRDLVAEERYSWDRLLIEAGLRSAVFVPLVVKGQALGTFDVGSRQVNAYGEKDLPLLQSLADQLAIAIENARLYSETQQRAGELAALYEITRDLAAQHDLPVLLQAVAERAATLLAAPGSGIYLYDAARDDLELVVTHGFPVPTGTRLQLGEGMAGRVAQTRQPLIVDDYRAWEYRSSRYTEIQFTAVVEVPMLYAGELIGVLSVHEIGATTRKFNEADTRLLSLFAAQAAGAVHNARLYQKVAASEQEYRTLVENATELIWALDTEGRFTFVNRQAEEVSGLKLRDFVGQSFAPLVAPPEDLPRIQQIFLETLAGKAQSYEVGVYHPDGRVFYLSVNATPLYRDGNVVGTIGFGRDVTAQKEAEVALKQRMAELSALFQVSSALRGVETVEEMLPIILDRTLEVIGADTGALFLLEKPSDHFTVRVARERMQAMLGFSFPREGSASARCLEIGQPLQDIQLPSGPDMAAALTGEENAIQIPLQVGQAAVGVMHLCFPGPHEFADDEIRLLTAIADMAANAIHRAGLFEQLQHRVHELAALFDVGKMITASLRIEDVLDFIVGAATEAVHARGSYLFLWDEREERLVMRATRGGAPGAVGRVKYRLGEGLTGWAFLEGRAANVADVAADPRWKQEPDYEATHPSGRIISALVVPLVVGGKTLGVLGVFNKIGAPAFTESDESLLTALAGQVAIAIENARLYEDVRGLSVATIRSLATAIDARDPYTRGHSEGVTRLAVALARALGWSGADLEMLEFAALLHDVGKIAVPDAVLRKVEPLTPDEWNVIRLHPFYSAQIVKPVESLRRIVAWVYHHQERWDGTGYPDGLKGEAIPLATRIISVADAFNAMTTNRPYRRGISVVEALEEIKRGAGGQFDPQLAKAFLQMMKQA